MYNVRKLSVLYAIFTDTDVEAERRDGNRKPHFILEANNAWAEIGYKAVIEAQAAGKPLPTFKW